MKGGPARAPRSFVAGNTGNGLEQTEAEDAREIAAFNAWRAEVQAEGDALEAAVQHAQEVYAEALDHGGPKYARAALDDLVRATLRRDTFARLVAVPCGDAEGRSA